MHFRGYAAAANAALNICADDWKLSNISLDLHNSDYEGNIMTEYEEKFSSIGNPICKMEARFL